MMVWGAISRRRVYPQVRIESTLDGEGYARLLDQFFKQWVVGPTRGVRAFRPRPLWGFQHDNAAIHRSTRAERMLRKWNATVLPWPAQSPDLSPIENLWSLVSRKLKGGVFSKPDQLWEAV